MARWEAEVLVPEADEGRTVLVCRRLNPARRRAWSRGGRRRGQRRGRHGGNPPLGPAALPGSLRASGRQLVDGALLLAWIVLTAGEFRHRTSVTTLLGQPRPLRVVPARLAAALTGIAVAMPGAIRPGANRGRVTMTRIASIPWPSAPRAHAYHHPGTAHSTLPALGSATISAALRASRPELGSHTVSVS